jgi:hypothetical protein
MLSLRHKGTSGLSVLGLKALNLAYLTFRPGLTRHQVLGQLLSPSGKFRTRKAILRIAARSGQDCLTHGQVG